MSGVMGDLSPEQQKSLEVFKEALGEEKLRQHDDYDFLRFLRARKFDLEKALLMYRSVSPRRSPRDGVGSVLSAMNGSLQKHGRVAEKARR